MGYTMYVGPELEYFYFKDSCGTELLDHGGYFDLTPLDAASDLRRDTILALQRSRHPGGVLPPRGGPVPARDRPALQGRPHHGRPGHDLPPDGEGDRHQGLYATFMPKPIFGENGSGMHVHQSLFKGSATPSSTRTTSTTCPRSASHTSPACSRHAREISLVTNQWVNSYKRLVPGYEAPVYLCWARRNRSALVRVPIYKPGKENATRVELRNPDPACNPYLAFAAMLAAGLDGIEKEMELLPEPSENIYEMTEEERQEPASTPCPRISTRRSRNSRSPASRAKRWATTCATTSSATSGRNGTSTRCWSPPTSSLGTSQSFRQPPCCPPGGPQPPGGSIQPGRIEHPKGPSASAEGPFALKSEDLTETAATGLRADKGVVSVRTQRTKGDDMDHRLTSTGLTIPGYRVVHTLGVVRGVTVRARWIGSQITASLRTLGGGQIPEYIELCEQTRAEAFSWMVQHAEQMGANAVIAVRYDATDLGNNMTEVLAYGTAAVVEPD